MTERRRRNLECKLNPRAYWHIEAVRSGGHVRVSLGHGQFGVPYAAQLD